VKAGEALFAQTIIGSQAGCATCHAVTPDTVIVGPSVAGIGTRAATTVPGLTAEEYIRQSILEPDAHVVEGFIPGLMVQVWQEQLSQEQLDNLVAYLLSLK
jgi:nitric oxide reductase subunit C